ncbi:MAG TPA: TetR family transcriptional regulator [Verrucomicrobiae bacterium]
MSRKKTKPAVTSRNPERTSARILAAALAEFAAAGFAGARVDAIAKRAGTNKRMLYHYFGDKEGLFRAVLRKKISERQVWGESLSGNPEDNLPFWFEAACKDPEWVRMLEWESLQNPKRKVIDEKERLQVVERALGRIRQRQERGQLSAEFDPRHLMLTMRSLTMFPMAFPQLTRLIMGREVFDPQFQRERSEFLKKFGTLLRAPNAPRRH